MIVVLKAAGLIVLFALVSTVVVLMLMSDYLFWTGRSVYNWPKNNNKDTSNGE